MLETISSPPRSRSVSAASLKIHLAELSASFVKRVTTEVPGVREGVVMTPGPKPYRRLDCDGRALVYLRARTRRASLRIDVSGLWVVPRDHPMRHVTASGAATLFVQTEADVDGAIAFLKETIERTQTAYAREAAVLDVK